MSESDNPLRQTPLHGAHVALGARLVPFAGYAMPVQYPAGILAEHSATRDSAGLFDVSHMGQCFIVADDGRHETIALALEALVPADLLNLPLGKLRYTQLLNEDGGILDDLMVTRSARQGDDGALGLVVNAARKEADYAHLEAKLPANTRLIRRDDRALIAIQGPKAAEILTRHCPDAGELGFMEGRASVFDGKPCSISRSGYTGEDGYEISIVAAYAEMVWNTLLADDRVKPVGLGARDSLRLEAGLCLYGHDIDETTSPVEAALTWSIQKRRREGGGFPGFARITRDYADASRRVRVGIRPEGRQPVREGAAIKGPGGDIVGAITSGGFGPTVGAPVAMGYVPLSLSAPDTALTIDLRGKDVAARVAPLPFVPHRYKR